MDASPVLNVPSSAALDIFDITPSDNNDLAFPIRAFRVYTTAGNVALITAAGERRVYPLAQLYERCDVRASRILATGTTAVGITGFR